MTSFAFSVIFLLAAGQPPTEGATQPASGEATAPKPEPKMICKFEAVTGSVRKQKVCRPEDDTGLDQATALQRKMDRYGDQRVGGGSLDVIGGGAGIGN